MLKLGVCTDIRNAKIIARAGFDYVETALNAVAAMSGEEFARAREELEQSGLVCEAVNCMLPGSLPVVGEGVDPRRLREYLEKAFARARELGADVVVFGSGASRRVPEGTSHWRAFRQLGEFLRLAAPIAGRERLRIALEPLSRSECNIINYVSEALELAALLDLPQVGVLGDTYHMDRGGEPLEALSLAGERLWHIHTACPDSRAFPRAGDAGDRRGDYRRLFQVLDGMGYKGGVSVEGNCGELAADAAESLRVLRGVENKIQ